MIEYENSKSDDQTGRIATADGADAEEPTRKTDYRGTGECNDESLDLEREVKQREQSRKPKP